MIVHSSRSMLSRWLESPIIATWAATLARLLSMTVILPFVVWKFDAATAAVWLVFASIASLRALADFGFTTTFIRLTGYARSGVPIDGLLPGALDLHERNLDGSDQVIAAVNTATQLLYRRLAIILGFTLLIAGSLAVAKPISFLENTSDGWAAWACVVIGTSSALYSGRYQAFLHGMDQVALHRRWEAAIHLAGLFINIVVVLTGGGLLELVAVSQAVLVVGMTINSRLCHRFSEFVTQSERKTAVRVARAAWPAVWRSGIGITASLGAVQIIGLTYAQLAAPAGVAALFLALRLAQVINLLSQPPFYAHIPRMVHFWASGQREAFLCDAQNGMRNSLFLVAIGFSLAGYCVPVVLEALGSEVQFVNNEFWLLLSLAYFLERYGAMHIQLHSMNNVIVWHWANGISGTIFVIGNLLLYPHVGTIALPIALLSSNSVFYIWFCAIKSFQLTGAPFFRFEARASLVPTIFMLAFTAFRAI